MFRRITVFVFLILAITAVSAWTTPCDISSFVAPHDLVGREVSGSTFAWEHRMDKGFSVRTLQIWFTNSGRNAVIQGMRVLFTDGTWSLTRGWEKDRFVSLTLHDGELITQVNLWGTAATGSGTSEHLARIEIQTSEGQTLTAGRDQSGIGYAPYVVNVGSGVLAGFFGSFGAQVDGGSFLFYKPIRSINVYNIVYSNAPTPGDTWGLSPRAIDQVVFRPTAEGRNWRFGGHLTHTESHSWSSQTTQTYGVKVTFSASFFVLKFKSEAFWTTEVITQSSSTISTDISLEWDIGGQATTNGSFVCSAKVYIGKLDMNWVGQIRFEFVDNSTSLVSSLTGTYKNVVYSRVDTQCNSIAE